MAVEYMLYSIDDMATADKVRKIKDKLKTQFSKNIDVLLVKETDIQLTTSLVDLEKTIKSLIDKELNETVEGIPVCTVTNNRVYIEMPYKELEAKMQEGNYIILGDNGSKTKSASSLKKYYKD